MDFFEPKAPWARLDYEVMHDLSNDKIISSTWSADSDDITITHNTHTDYATTVWVEGGVDGTFYTLTNRVETEVGRRHERRFVLPVGNVRREPENLTVTSAIWRVRNFIRDHRDINTLLLSQFEYTWGEIEDSIYDALNDWNATQPISNHTLEHFPKAARGLLYQRSAIYLLRMAANGQARNQLQYSDQGFSVVESDKAPIYLQIAAGLEQVYEDRKAKFKAAENAEATWGGHYSDSFYDPGDPYHWH